MLADGKCNAKKRDRLPACEHLESWVERNAKYGGQLGEALERRGLVAEIAASRRIAEWAYSQTEAVRDFTWVRADEMIPLAPEWRELLAPQALEQTIP